MQRPPSILLFERMYLAGLAISVIFGVLHWSADLAGVMGQPSIAGIKGSARILPVVYPIVRVLIWAGWVLLWYLVALRASRIGKVLVTIAALAAAYDGAGVLLAVLSGPLAGWAATVALIEAALIVAAAAMLFRSDARRWLAERMMA